MNLSAKYNRTANNVNRTQNLNFMHSNACRWLYALCKFLIGFIIGFIIFAIVCWNIAASFAPFSESAKTFWGVDKYKHDTDGQIKAKAATFGGFIGGLSLGWLLYYGESRNFVRPQMSDF